jgi:hypothetical protein
VAKPCSNPKNRKAIQRSATKFFMSHIDLKKAAMEAGATYRIELPKGKSLHQVDAVRVHRSRVNANIITVLCHARDIAPHSSLWTTPTPRSGGSPRAAAWARRSTLPTSPSLWASSLLDPASSYMAQHQHGAGAAPPRRGTMVAGSDLCLMSVFLLLKINFWCRLT